MHLLSTSKLADEIVADRVSTREKAAYFVMLQVLVIALGYAAGFSPPQNLWMYVYEGLVVCVVTFAGAGRVVSSYGRPLDTAFFEATYLLSVPLLVTTTVAAWVAMYGGSWLFSTMIPHVSATSAESADALSYWLGRLWWGYTFIVAVVITIVFWVRLAHHVGYVASKRVA